VQRYCIDTQETNGADLTTARNKNLNLEKAIGDLEELVEQLESGELTLDKSLQQFEKGIKLSRECQVALTEAEQKVQILIDSELKDLDTQSLENKDTD
jgi:exodeoxyribonuclease VII small subunit